MRVHIRYCTAGEKHESTAVRKMGDGRWEDGEKKRTEFRLAVFKRVSAVFFRLLPAAALVACCLGFLLPCCLCALLPLFPDALFLTALLPDRPPNSKPARLPFYPNVPDPPVPRLPLTAHPHRLVHIERSHIAVLDVPDLQPLRSHGSKKHRQRQRPMHEKVAVPLHVAGVGLVQMDAVRVEGQGREAEEQGLGGGDYMLKFGVRGGLGVSIQ